MPARVESVPQKAYRLLAEGRLHVKTVNADGRIEATCQGDHGEYTLGFNPAALRWWCDCPEQKGGCSHLYALRLVTTRVKRD